MVSNLTALGAGGGGTGAAAAAGGGPGALPGGGGGMGAVARNVARAAAAGAAAGAAAAGAGAAAIPPEKLSGTFWACDGRRPEGSAGITIGLGIRVRERERAGLRAARRASTEQMRRLLLRSSFPSVNSDLIAVHSSRATKRWSHAEPHDWPPVLQQRPLILLAARLSRYARRTRAKYNFGRGALPMLYVHCPGPLVRATAQPQGLERRLWRSFLFAAKNDPPQVT